MATAKMLFEMGAFDLESGVTRSTLFAGVCIAKETAVSRLRALQWEGYVGRHAYSPRKVVWWLSERGVAWWLNANKVAGGK